jgi:hypothetical protein
MMSSLSFSLSDYQEELAKGLHTPPAALCPYYEVDPGRYRHHGDAKRRRDHPEVALAEVRKRVGGKRFREIYTLQTRTLGYSANAFPAYRFILAEVLTEDWLAAVDSGKFHRDHVLHQPLCGYIMLQLLEWRRGVRRGPTLLDACVEALRHGAGTSHLRDRLLRAGVDADKPPLDPEHPMTRAIWRAFLREAAYVTAVLHDLGYPWQYAERLHGNLDGANVAALRPELDAAEVIRQFGPRLLGHALQGYSAPTVATPSTWEDEVVKVAEQALAGTHGLPGALGFLHLNDCIRRYPCPREVPLRLLLIEWVAAAILMHDMCKVYWGEAPDGVPEHPFLRLSFGTDPLSTLITLVDIIQDFERPSVVYGTRPGGRVTLEYRPACKRTDLTLKDGVLTILYHMASVEDRANKLKFLPKERREFFDPRYGYLDLTDLGIDEVRMEAVCKP